MPIAALESRVRALLADVPHVEEKKMFGGTMFMVNGKMCVSARQSRIMCRIDPARHDAAIERPGCTTMTMKGRSYRGYVHVSESVLRTKRELTTWIEMALDYNARAPLPARTARKRRAKAESSSERSAHYAVNAKR